MMFLRECATRLDAGEPSDSVMSDLRARYSTLQCINVKTCLVRSMCTPCEEYVRAQRHLDQLIESDADADVIAAHRRTLPPRLPENVRRFTVSRAEARTCRRVSMHRTVLKNMSVERVPGRELLERARRILHTPHDVSLPELTFSIALATGRRECEILNGRSQMTVHTDYSCTFAGQAKKRHRDARDGEVSFIIPVLAPSHDVVDALEELRARQNHCVLTNRETSRRYQSLLSRSLHATHPWSACKRVHSLRGIYTCAVTQLFRWGDHSNAFVAMCVLGHAGLTESLTYTSFRIGEDVGEAGSLGDGHLTQPSTMAEPVVASCGVPDRK